MGALATDRSLLENELELLAAAADGDRRSLQSVCSRFKVPALAFLLNSGSDLEAAAKSVPRLLTSLCHKLRYDNLAPNQFGILMEQHVAGLGIVPLEDDDSGEASGFGALPRIVRRRVIRKTLPNLPLPELMALLMFYIEKSQTVAMVGLVDETDSKSKGRLVNAHNLLSEAISRSLNTE